jgi:hypothetical protein
MTSSRCSDEQSSHSNKQHRILFSRNNTYNSDYSAPFSGFYEYDPISRVPYGLPSVGPNDTHRTEQYENKSERSIQSLLFNKSETLENPLLQSSSQSSSTFWGWSGWKSTHYLNYIIFCISFSLNSAPVICSLIYAPAVIGNEIGALGNGVFYLSYVFFTLFINKTLLTSLGYLKLLLISHYGIFLYLLSYIIYVRQHQHHHPHNISIAYTTAYFLSIIIGGWAQSIHWTIHSKYFSQSCQMMLSSMNQREIQTMNRRLSFQFAIIYFLTLIAYLIGCTFIIANPFEVTHIIWYMVLPIYLILHLLSLLCYSRLDDYGNVGEIAQPSSRFRFSSWKPLGEFSSMVFAVKTLPRRMKLKLAL